MHYTASVLGQATAAVLCALLTVPAPLPAPLVGRLPAPEPAARQAAELTHARRYAEAAEAYARAFEETGEPVHLYGQAMSLRRAGSCPEAIDVFEAFIAERPPEPDVEAARTQIGECQALIARAAPKPTPRPEPKPVITPPPPATAETDTPDSGRASWARDPWGGVLLAVGGLASITGGGLLLVSNGSTDAPAAETERAHARREADVRNTSTAGFVLIGAGAALLVGGIVRYSILARRGRADRISDGGLTWRF